MTEAQDQRIIDVVIDRYGHTLDLRERPDILIDILRRFGPGLGADQPDGGTPPLPGGVPPEPKPAPEPKPTPEPPGPSRGDLEPTIIDVMRELLSLSQRVDLITAALQEPG